MDPVIQFWVIPPSRWEHGSSVIPLRGHLIPHSPKRKAWSRDINTWQARVTTKMESWPSWQVVLTQFHLPYVREEEGVVAFYLGKKSLNFVIRQIIDILASLRYTNVETKLCWIKGELVVTQQLNFHDPKSRKTKLLWPCLNSQNTLFHPTLLGKRRTIFFYSKCIYKKHVFAKTKR